MPSKAITLASPLPCTTLTSAHAVSTVSVSVLLIVRPVEGSAAS
jgi:hypothetical protein